MPIVIEGLAELSNVLTELTPKAAKRYLSNAGEKAAQVVVDNLEQTVPVEVGYLEEMLGWQKKWIDGGDQTTMEIVIGPLKPAYWGSFQEFGTRYQAGQHWMGRAWEGCRDQCLSVFATEALGILADLENKRG
jgi:HK97 gp10 family phage protein